MDLKNMPIKIILKKLTESADQDDEMRFEKQIASNPMRMKEYNKVKTIWQEAEKVRIFDRIDTDSDWEDVSSRINLPLRVSYHGIPLYRYLSRTAAILILAVGLSIGFYRIVTTINKTDNGFITWHDNNAIKEVVLPDGSTVSLNIGSTLSYHAEFNDKAREVILEGEALFNVIPDPEIPFKVYTGGSIIEVTGTSFSICEESGVVKVAVITGTVLLSTAIDQSRKISISANQSGYVLSNNELKVENRIEKNNLSWKTGYLSFDETPLDTALIDIARHFRKELHLETTITDEITAEFQNQPLREILSELEQVAGLEFDTSGTSLIVRK
jgi:transmembrane sensor